MQYAKNKIIKPCIIPRSQTPAGNAYQEALPPIPEYKPFYPILCWYLRQSLINCIPSQRLGTRKSSTLPCSLLKNSSSWDSTINRNSVYYLTTVYKCCIFKDINKKRAVLCYQHHPVIFVFKVSSRVLQCLLQVHGTVFRYFCLMILTTDSTLWKVESVYLAVVARLNVI